MEQKLLAVYLNDHLAGSVLGRELVARAARSNRGTELGRFLEALEGEIREDKATLERVLATAGVRRSLVKPRVAWTLEKAGRLKLNGRILSYSPLSRLLELEGLTMGVAGKRALWQTLGEIGDPRLAGFEFAALAERAERQLEALEPHRLAAARLAFGESSPSSPPEA